MPAPPTLHPPALVEYRQVSSSLDALPERERVDGCKLALLRSLERAHALGERLRASQERIAELEALATLRPDDRDRFLRHLHAKMLAQTKKCERLLRSSRRQQARLQRHSDALASDCRALLATLEHAVFAKHASRLEPDLPSAPSASA